MKILFNTQCKFHKRLQTSHINAVERCNIVLFTSFAHFEPNVATHSHHRTSHHKRTFLIRLLFTSFAHFEPNVATHSHHRTSHHKRTFLIRLLFPSFAHFEPNVATHSHHRTSHH